MHIFSQTVITNLITNSLSGWSRESLEDWGVFGKLAIFGVMMSSIEWWALEVGMFLAGNDSISIIYETDKENVYSAYEISN